jgi:hypothetical protein
MLAVAQHLNSAGHDVTILTSDVFKNKVIADGLDFVPVTGIANYDYRRPEDFFPDKKNLRGMDLMIHYLKYLLGDTIPDQDRSIRQIMAERPLDLILVDVPCLGAFPLALGPKNKRPPIVGCGVIPIMSRDFDVPKVSPESAAVGIFDGLENGEEDIFPDPTSRPIADGWRAGVAKALERRINAVVLEGAQIDIRERL